MGYLAPRGSTPGNAFLAPVNPPSGAAGAPTITAIAATGGTAATLTFTPGAGATSHQVEFETPSGAANWLACPGAFVGSTFNATGFTPAQSLQLRLRGVNGIGPSAWVLSGTFFTDNTGNGSVEIPSVPVTAPSITLQPANQGVLDGTLATFSTAATANPTATVKWQISADAGATWSDISGATSATYTRTGVLADSGKLFRAIWANGVSPDATTTAATLTVTAVGVAPSITTQPTAQSVVAGSTATFVAAASGTPTPTVQWQRSTNGGAAWSAISGATSTTYTTPATTVSGGAANNGDLYRAVFSNGVNPAATTNSAALGVSASTSAPSITTQPTDTSVVLGSSATFSVAATGTAPLAYQWQRSGDAGATWTDIAGAASSTYAMGAAVEADNAAKFRCVVSNGVSPNATSAGATLTVTGIRPALVNPVLFEDMLSRVLPWVPSCPPQTAVYHLRQVATDFFQRTLAWRDELPPLVTVVGQDEYTLLPPQESVVAKLLSYKYDGVDVDVIDAEAGRLLALQEAGTQVSWTNDRSVVNINPVPATAGKSLGFRAALKPATNGGALPGLMYEQYIDHIVDGALARLLAMPSKDWTDLNTAAVHKGMYEVAVARVSRMTSKGFARPTARRVNF